MEDAIGKNLEVFVTKTEAQATASDFVAAHPAALCISSDTKSIVFGGQVLTLGDHQAKVNKWVDEKRVLKLNGLEAVGSATINSTTTAATSTDQLIWATDKKAVYLKRDGQYYNNWTEYKMASSAFIFGSDYCQNITASGCLAVIGVDLYLISKSSNHIQLTSASGDVADGSLTESKLSQDLAEKINGKQEKLTLEVLSNGNIKIGNLNGQTKEFMPATPSGDPMHEAYQLLGSIYNKNAVYNNGADTIQETLWKNLVDDADYNAKWGINVIPNNATFVKTLKFNGVDREIWEFDNPLLSNRKVWAVAEYANDGTRIWDDKVYISRGGMWRLASLGDLTNADMRKILLSPYATSSIGSCGANMGRVVCKNGSLSNIQLPQYFLNGQKSEVCMFGYMPTTNSGAISLPCKAFVPYERIVISHNISTTTMQYCRMTCEKSVALNIPKISAKSIIFMLNKISSTVTITFPSALYDRLMDTSTTLGAELVALLESKSNITFARGE